MVKKAIKKTLTEQVTDSLLEAISTGELHPGDKLPSESALAEEFGTSRLTVRLAIQKLNAMELLETRDGDGTYVKAFSFSKYIDNVAAVIFTPEMMGDIEDYRNCIEFHCALLACRNRTEEDLITLEKLCGQFEESYQSASEKLTEEVLNQMGELDYAIHLKICEMSKNALFHISYQMMHPALVQYMKIVIRNRKSIYDENQQLDKFLLSLKTHRLLCEAIRKRDESSCIDIMTNMINYKVLMNDSYLKDANEKT